MARIINFDNSATTYPKPVAVRNAVDRAVVRYGGNPGRSGHRLSMQVSEQIFKVRTATAEMFGAQTENVAFYRLVWYNVCILIVLGGKNERYSQVRQIKARTFRHKRSCFSRGVKNGKGG